MTDRELLELAAKAAGFANFEYGSPETGICVELGTRRGAITYGWNPLADDGDALRLAVKLNLSMRFDTLPDGPIAAVAVEWADDFDGYWWNEWLEKDAAAATRRAIVRAAAELGKEMT
jgi:hypothetical protein